MLIELAHIFKKNHVRNFNHFCIKNPLHCSILKWYRICVLILTVPPGADFSDLPVAFYAYIDYQGAFLTLSSHTTLVFDSIKINDGNGYNISDGIFTARRTGVYAFHWSVTIYNDSWASVELVVNETPIGCVAAETQVVKKWGRGSGLVITNINNGDRVFLRMQENGLGSIRISDRGRTSFSGWLLQP